MKIRKLNRRFSGRYKVSNLWVNWRFGKYHLQIGWDYPFVALRYNPYWEVNKPTHFFERY